MQIPYVTQPKSVTGIYRLLGVKVGCSRALSCIHVIWEGNHRHVLIGIVCLHGRNQGQESILLMRLSRNPEENVVITLKKRESFMSL